MLQMCTNTAIADNLECYMEDMVECFEDFVKKSLVIITLAVGAVVGMLVYLLKNMNDRSLAGTGVGCQQTGVESSTVSNVCQQSGRGAECEQGKVVPGESCCKRKSSKYDEDNVSCGSISSRESKASTASKGSRCSRESRVSLGSIDVKQSTSKDSFVVTTSVSTGEKESGAGKCIKAPSVCPKAMPKCVRSSPSRSPCCCPVAPQCCQDAPTDCTDMNNCPRRRSQLRKPCVRASTSSCNSRVTIPSLAPCNIPKRQAKPVNNRYSCCSVCCNNEQQG